MATDDSPFAESDAPTYSEFHLGNFAYASVCTLCGALVPLSRYWQERHTGWHTTSGDPEPPFCTVCRKEILYGSRCHDHPATRDTTPAALDDWGHYPYDHKSIAEIIYDFAVLRGDLSEEYARSQLVAAIERKIAHATRPTPPAACPHCGHTHTPEGCVAGATPVVCECGVWDGETSDTTPAGGSDG